MQMVRRARASDLRVVGPLRRVAGVVTACRLGRFNMHASADSLMQELNAMRLDTLPLD